MASNIVRIAYGVVKGAGIDTSDMTVEEVIAKMNELQDGDKVSKRDLDEKKLKEKGYTAEQLKDKSDKDTADTAEKFGNEKGGKEERMRQIDEEIEKQKKSLTEGITKDVDAWRDAKTGKLINANKRGEFFLTDDETKASTASAAWNIYKNMNKLQQQGLEPVKISVKKTYGEIPYEDKQKIERQIEKLKTEKEALQQGYDTLEEYQSAKTEENTKKRDARKEEIDNSYFGKHYRKDFYGVYYDYYGYDKGGIRNFYAPEIDQSAAIELFARRAKALGATYEHASAKSGEGKFSTSIYLTLDGKTLRISNHELPDAPWRDTLTNNWQARWDDEIVFGSNADKSKMTNEMLKAKTQKEFDDWVLSKFKSEED